MMEVGIIGWRGMVGSVLLERMRAERDFDLIDPVFFSTSQAGGAAPDIGRPVASKVQDANDLARARAPAHAHQHPGRRLHPGRPRRGLRESGWRGYWIDAASTLRMAQSSVIVLDPVNLPVMQCGARRGHQGFHRRQLHRLADAHGGVRARCARGLVEWISAMTYQSASGAGAQNMRELLEQMGALHRSAAGAARGSGIGDPRHRPRGQRCARAAPISRKAHFGAPLAASLIPWIDKDLGNGQSREEWKAGAESNKIMGTEASPVPVEGICVRVSAMRCHSQALTIKLKRDVPLAEIEAI